jgi:hypothetical protein
MTYRIHPRALRRPLVSLLALLALLPGCGGGQTSTTPAAREAVPLTQLLHPRTPVVGAVDMDGVRRSPYYAAVREALEGVPEADGAQVQQVLAVLDRTGQLAWGFAPGEPTDAASNLIALRGRDQTGDLDALGPLPEAAAYREHALRGEASDDSPSPLWASVVNGDTLLVGAMDALHDGIDRLDGIFPGSGPTRPGYAEAAARARLGERDFSLVVVFTEALRAELGEGHVEHVLRENGVSAGLSVHARQGLELDAFVTTNDARAVPILAHALRGWLGEAQGDMGVTAVGASGLLEQVQVVEEDTTLRAQLRVSDDDTRALVDNAASLLRTLFAGL